MKPENKEKLEVQELDEEKPGLGQHVRSTSGVRRESPVDADLVGFLLDRFLVPQYCLECAKYVPCDLPSSHWISSLHSFSRSATDITNLMKPSSTTQNPKYTGTSTPAAFLPLVKLQSELDSSFHLHLIP